MTVLVVAAHPDDEILGCGGTMARHVHDGDTVHIAILGEGISSRFDRRDAAESAALDALRDDARAAAAAVGVRSVRFGGLPDNRFDQVAMLDVVKQVESWVAEIRPDVIYTQHPGDLNVDHGLTCRAVLTATRPCADWIVRDIYAFPVASSSEWAFGSISPAFAPTVFVDIAPWLDAKVAAMECYRSERRQAPHPRAPEQLRAAASHWGAAAGMAAAEPFALIRSLRR